MDKLEEIYKRLMSWVDALNNAVNAERLEHLLKIMKGEVELLDEQQSKASAAEMEIRGIEKKLDEVNAAFKDLKKAIWEEE